jgi:protein phosphatase
MGSRAVVIVCRDPEVAARRFKIDDPIGGTIHTRTGRAFFADPAWQAKVVEGTRAAISAADLWDALDTDWLALDTELLPWSAKAEDLLRSQYAAVGASGHAMTTRGSELLAQAMVRGIDVADLAHRTEDRVLAIDRFVDAYRQYCWSVEEPDDLQLAPFVVLAAEGTLLAERDHAWHMSVAERLAAAGDGFVRPTRNITVDLADPDSEAAAVAWWEQLVAGGGEGMVVKPVESIVTGKRGLIQPGIKCRGPEYLRIIYGPEYLVPANLERLRERGLGKKRSLAQREFALGIEALERFVAGEPLHRVHECVFGVLAMESEPVDPRL